MNGSRLEEAVPLHCPQCRGRLKRTGADFTCPSRHGFPLLHGYLDLTVGSADDRVTGRALRSFGFEWNAFDRDNHEDEHYWRWHFADLALQQLAGGVTLDVGCGKGRYTRFTSVCVGVMVALDGSAAVEAAARNLVHIDNIIVVKADLRAAVLAPGSFNFVSCLEILAWFERAGLEVEALREDAGVFVLGRRPKPGG